MALDTALAKKAYKEIVEKRTNIVRTTFMNNDVDFLELKITDSFVIPIIQFLQQRSKGGEHGVLA
jgi:hypothetical protein